MVPINEVQRQEYLSAMGIQVYFPRYRLPGAKVTVQVPLPDVAGLNPPLTDISLQTEGRAEGQAETPEAQVTETVQKVTSDNTDAEANLTVADVVSDIVLDPVADPRFQLAVFRLGAKVCVLNQMPYVGMNQQLSSQHKELLKKIYAALALGSEPADLDNINYFRWPFVETSTLDNSAAAAQLALNAYLEQQYCLQSFEVLIVMGERVAAFAETGAMSETNRSWQIVNIASLDEMLRAWQFKRDAWHKLVDVGLFPLGRK